MKRRLTTEQSKAPRQRRLLVLATFAYICSFHMVYVYYLNDQVAHFGFSYDPPSVGIAVLGWSLALAPSLWMPLRLSRPSQLAYWILYIVVLIPSMLVPIYTNILMPADTVTLVVTMFVAFAIPALTYRLPLFRVRDREMSPGAFNRLIFGCFVVLGSWFLYVNRNALALVSFKDVYDLRFNADELMAGSYVNYAGMLLSGAIDPFLMAWGLFFRRPLLFVTGAVGQVMVYAGWGTKGSISSIAFMSGFYLLVRGNRKPFGLKLVTCVTCILVLLFGLYIAQAGDVGVNSSTLFFLVFGRIFTVQGLLTAQYFDFFSRNPVTHYSTVNGINWFVQNPYSQPIGVEVGYAVTGDPLYDAIAHFWASDGIAAYGLAGIIAISALCAAVFWVLDSMSQRHDPRFGALATAYAAYNLANIPLFTSLLSGGLGALALWLYLMPSQEWRLADATPKVAPEVDI